MSVDLLKIKVGDTVTSTFIVEKVVEGKFGERYIGYRTALGWVRYILGVMITDHTPAPKPIAVGDAVEALDHLGHYYQVIDTHDKWAWCKEISSNEHPVPSWRPVCFEINKLRYLLTE